MCYQLHITLFLLKVPLFNKNKALQQKAKELELASSPDRTIIELFV
jgi:hypothetical protein